MSWRDELRPASFRGVHFKVRSTEDSFGRRQVRHEFPQRDRPYTEDMGRKADEFVVEGYLLGDDYNVARDRLVEACRDQTGPGTLIHPYLGERTVTCQGLRVRHSTEDGRMCVIAMTFVEEGDPIGDVIEDTAGTVRTRAAAVKAAAKKSFLQRFLTDGMPGFVLASAQTFVENLTSALDFKGLKADLAASADFAYAVRNLNADAAALVATPEGLADRITDTLSLLRGAFSGSADLLLGLFDDNDGAATAVSGTASRVQEAENENALRGLVRQIALAEAASQRVAETPASHQDAVAAREGLTDRIDAEAEAADDDAYPALLSLRADVARAIPAPGETLPELITYTPPVTLPSLVIAQQLYGDAGREAEIVARNSPRHPGFMTGGVPLEVISDG